MKGELCKKADNVRFSITMRGQCIPMEQTKFTSHSIGIVLVLAIRTHDLDIQTMFPQAPHLFHLIHNVQHYFSTNRHNSAYPTILVQVSIIEFRMRENFGIIMIVPVKR